MTIPPPADIRRIVYLGTPALAVPPLRALYDAGLEIPLVVTRVDKRRGRGGAMHPTPVKAAATELGIPVSHSLDDALAADADLGVVVAYGRIIPASVLDRLAMVNIHFSLLPRWRGAAPVERALLAGDERTGVCLMVVEESLDTGGVYRRSEIEITDDATLDSLRRELVEIGTRQLVDALREGLGDPAPQQGDPVYAEKVRPDELEIDWFRDTSSIHRLVRLGGAWTTFRGKRLKIHKATPVVAAEGESGTIDGLVVATDDGGLELAVVQPEGRARVDAAAWRNGAHPGPDDRLGAS